MASEDTLKEKIHDLEKEIAVLDWDKKHNQLNPSKGPYLDNLKKELKDLEEQLEKIETVELPTKKEQKKVEVKEEKKEEEKPEEKEEPAAEQKEEEPEEEKKEFKLPDSL